MSDISHYLNECQNIIGKITITKEFEQLRNEMSVKFKSNGRDKNTKLLHADCLIVEYMLIQNGFVLYPENKKHDFILDSFRAKVDAKVVDKYFNIPSDKLAWYIGNINENELTHFAFYKWISRPIRPLQEGDIVELEFISSKPARDILNNLSISNGKYGDGYYYMPHKS
jgi:phage pi2 protein 07